jgi:hypothetical protein
MGMTSRSSWPTGSPPSSRPGVATQALDELQDYISEATHDPWPGTTAQPRPYARIRDSMLYLGYGDPDAPILTCAPIPLLPDP